MLGLLWQPEQLILLICIITSFLFRIVIDIWVQEFPTFSICRFSADHHGDMVMSGPCAPEFQGFDYVTYLVKPISFVAFLNWILFWRKINSSPKSQHEAFWQIDDQHVAVSPSWSMDESHQPPLSLKILWSIPKLW